MKQDCTLQKRQDILNATGLLNSIPDQTLPQLKGGRLKNLMTRLQDALVKTLELYVPLHESEFIALENKVRNFGLASQWNNKAIPIPMLVELSMLLAERYEFDSQVSDLLNLLYEYYERVNDTDIQQSRTAAYAMRL